MMNRSSSLFLRGAALSALTALAAISLVLGGCVDDRQISGEGGSGGGTSTGTQGTTSGTGGAMASCTSFPDDAPLGSVMFTVHNNRAVPIYARLPVCFGRFGIAASPGAAPQYADLAQTDRTCEDPNPPPLDCLDDSVSVIEAGGTLDLGWNGLLFAHPTLPSGCPAPTDSIILSCFQGSAPAAGTMEVSVYLYESASCNAGTGDCISPMGDFLAKQTFKYPDDTQVQVDVN